MRVTVPAAAVTSSPFSGKTLVKLTWVSSTSLGDPGREYKTIYRLENVNPELTIFQILLIPFGLRASRIFCRYQPSSAGANRGTGPGRPQHGIAGGPRAQHRRRGPSMAQQGNPNTQVTQECLTHKRSLEGRCEPRRAVSFKQQFTADASRTRIWSRENL